MKILGNGEIDKKLTFTIKSISGSAKAKIEKAGGTIAVVEEKKEGKDGK